MLVMDHRALFLVAPIVDSSLRGTHTCMATKLLLHPSSPKDRLQPLAPNVPSTNASGSGPDESKDDADEDVEEVDVPVAWKGKRRAKLGNFSADEDVNLVKAWLEISCDPITSTGQKKDRLWARILERFNLRRGSSPERSVKSLQCRWDIIKAEVGKFSSCYAQVLQENPSGMTDSCKVTHAVADFASIVKHKFAFMHCWEIMKNEPKWQDPNQRALGNSSAGEGFGEDITHGPDSATASVDRRPMGRNSAKAAKKIANSSAGSMSSSEYASRMEDLSLKKISMFEEESVCKNERFQQLASIDEKRFEEMRRHHESLLHIEQEKIQIMREQHEMEKEQKEKQEDERILGIDLNSCTTAQRIYYQPLQEEIFEKIAARRGKRHVP